MASEQIQEDLVEEIVRRYKDILESREPALVKHEEDRNCALYACANCGGTLFGFLPESVERYNGLQY